MEQTPKAIRDDAVCNRVITSRAGANDETREQILGLSKTKETEGQSESKVSNIIKNGKNNLESNNKDTSNKKREPCKLLCLNVQGLINKHTKQNKQKNPKWKIDAIKEYVNTNNIILMNFTETWLGKKFKMKNDQILQHLDAIGKA